jgi:hypothetical protein
MVNERHAVRWGIPSQLLTRFGGVTQHLGWGALRRQRRHVRRQERRVATALVWDGEAPLGRSIVVGRRPAAVEWQAHRWLLAPVGVDIVSGWLTLEIVVGVIPPGGEVGWSVLTPWRVHAGVRSSGLLGLAEAVGHVPDLITVIPPHLEPSVLRRLRLIPLRLRFSREQLGQWWTRSIRRASESSTVGPRPLVAQWGRTWRLRPVELLEIRWQLWPLRQWPVLVGPGAESRALGRGITALLHGWPRRRSLPGLARRWAAIQPQRWGSGAPRLRHS